VPPESDEKDEDKTGESGVNSEEVERQIDEKVNKAISNHLTRFRTAFEKEQAKTFSALLGEAVGPINETLKALAERPEPTPPAGGEGEGGKDDLERKRLEAQIKDLEARAVRAEQEREQERATRAREEERNELSKALGEQGITGARQRAAMALLYTEEQRVVRDDDNAIRFTVPKGGYVDEVPLSDGIAEWLKTEEGKTFLPPRGSHGSGNTGSETRNNRPPRTPAEKKAKAQAELMAAFGVATGEG
jgi:hypothetical protein